MQTTTSNDGLFGTGCTRPWPCGLLWLGTMAACFTAVYVYARVCGGEGGFKAVNLLLVLCSAVFGCCAAVPCCCGSCSDVSSPEAGEKRTGSENQVGGGRLNAHVLRRWSLFAVGQHLTMPLPTIGLCNATVGVNITCSIRQRLPQ